MTTAALSQRAFFGQLKKYYSWYTGGFILFLVVLAVAEQLGMSRRWIGYWFLFATIALYAGIGMTANVALSLTLFVVLGSVGIAIATAIAGWLQAALLAGTLRQRGDFELDAISKRRFPAIIAATLIMGVVVFLLTRLLAGGFAPENGILIQAGSLAGLVGGGLLAYGIAAEALGAVELRSLFKRLRGA